jgi:hypothetical protein
MKVKINTGTDKKRLHYYIKQENDERTHGYLPSNNSACDLTYLLLGEEKAENLFLFQYALMNM